jgi:hypothetical protein
MRSNNHFYCPFCGVLAPIIAKGKHLHCLACQSLFVLVYHSGEEHTFERVPCNVYVKIARSGAGGG